MVDNFCNVAALFGADISDKSTEVFPSQADFNSLDELLAELGGCEGEQFIALNPGASAPSNRWLPERFAELINQLVPATALRVVLLGGPQDRDIVREIDRQTNAKYIELTGRLSLMQLAAMYTRCKLVITGDTGPMHLAVAMKTPVLVLFGPAVPSESGPDYAPGNRIIRKVEGCPKWTKYHCTQNQACMAAISAKEVFAEAMDMLG